MRSGTETSRQASIGRPGRRRRFVAGFMQLILAEALVLGPLALFARILGAEGPIALLFGWTALVVALLFFALAPALAAAPPGAAAAGPANEGNSKRAIKYAFVSLAAVAGIAGVLAVLVQVSVAHRSLAEAWLELAREGRAFGFFSFFASEVYALFLIAQIILFIRRKWTAFLLAFAASALMCAGIISGKSALLALAVLCALAFLALAGTVGPAGYRRRLHSISAPFGAAAVISLLFAFNPTFPVNTPFTGFNVEKVFSAVAPSFPLIRDVPGYGFSADAGEMPSAVYLSGRTLFRVRGDRYSVHYLATERYRDWNGETWSVDPATGDELPVSRMGRNDAIPPRSLRLTLEEDFTPAIPLDMDTASVAVAADAPEKFTAFRNRGIRFEPSIRRGCVADLVPGSVPVTATDETETASLLGGEGVKSERISALAKTLKEKASGDRAYITAILDHLSEGYEYSLRKGPTAKGESPVESFLFTEKKGFCLYFASAFVLLAREGGLPARLVEGYRVKLDEHGQGVISGNNAHAWPEVWLDGDWQTFEPTPPYRLADPFALTASGDRETQRQLEALFGVRKGSEGKQKVSALAGAASFIARWKKTVVISLGAIAAVMLAVLKLANTETRKLKRKARTLVRRCARKGIPGPGTTGWTVWKIAASGKLQGEAAETAKRTADAMIALTFAPPRE